MANEILETEEQQEVRAKNKKKKTEEDEVHQILWSSLSELQSSVQALNKAINFNEDNPRKLAILVNARARVQQQIFYCIALLENPKLKLMTDTGRNRDFARIIQRALLNDNPAAKKMVEEAKLKDTTASSGSHSASKSSSSIKERENSTGEPAATNHGSDRDS